jgi:peptidoglycan hydrolase-like protein with peptidoglycan-binding domain
VVGEPLTSPRAAEVGSPTRRSRGRLLTIVVSAIVTGAVVLVVVDPFGGDGRSVGGNDFSTSLQMVTERGLFAQTQVNGTLGFGGDATIRVPLGIAPNVVSEDRGSVASDRRLLGSAHSLHTDDQVTLADTRATLTASEQRLSVDCAGDNAAADGSSSTQGAGASGGSACASDAQSVSSDRQTQAQAAAKVNADQRQVSSAERALADARSQLSSARAHETFYGQGSTYTGLPSPGHVVGRGKQLFAIDGHPVLLLYGSTIARRAFVDGMSSGPDVVELNANLDALGYGHGLSGGAFTSATVAAIRALQRARGIDTTGSLQLGSVVFEPGAVRVTSVMSSDGVGASVTPGPLLTVSSTERVVTIQLDSSLEGEVNVGDPVIITLPDNTTTPGRISYVSSVATSSGQNGTSIRVQAAPDHPGATGKLDQAPVEVQITTGSVSHALVVPVDALLALNGGRYAVEEVSHHAHHLVTVSTGLFDDADGLVQVSGRGLVAGQHVVVPGP